MGGGEYICILGVGLPIAGALFLAVYQTLSRRGALNRARQALREDRLSEALVLFRESALSTFSDLVSLDKTTFTKSLEGLSQVYKKADKSVDLEPIRQIRQEVVTLHNATNKMDVIPGAPITSLTFEVLKIPGNLRAEQVKQALIEAGIKLIKDLPDV